MKKIALIFGALAFTFSLQSCDFTEAYFPGEELINPGEFNTLNEYFNFQNVPSDTLWFDPTQPIVANFPNGLTIKVDQGCCGATPPDSIAIVARHYPTVRRMIWGNVHTVSNDQMLVTGGAFWWTAVDPNQQQLTIAPNLSSAEVNVVTNVGTYRNAMTHYTGSEVAAGGQTVLNWTVVPNAQANFQGQSNVFVINQLNMGWVNVDALYNYTEGEATQFTVKLNNMNGVVPGEVRVFLVADQVPSLMNITTVTNDLYHTPTNAIPTGLNAKLLAVAMRADGSFMVGTLPITVAGDDNFEIDLQARTYQELVQIVNSVTN